MQYSAVLLLFSTPLLATHIVVENVENYTIGFGDIALGVESENDFVRIELVARDATPRPETRPLRFGAGDCSLEDNFRGVRVGVTRVTAYRPPFTRGDTDDDWRITIADATTTLEYLFLAGTVSCPAAVDSNGDGQLNVSDATYLLRYLFADGAAPPAPFPSPGPDALGLLPCE